jgi:hypothetical protein
MPTNEGKEGYVEVFCRYITKNGKKIYPRNAQYFHFWVKA